MTIQNVERPEWPAFLAHIGRQHCAWIGSVHGLVAGAEMTRIPSVALKSVSVESGVSGPILRITFLNNVSLCAVRPSAVRVQTEVGVERALEVETADDGFIRLAFRASALPEQLDGIAPGESTAQLSHEPSPR